MQARRFPIAILTVLTAACAGAAAPSSTPSPSSQSAAETDSIFRARRDSAARLFTPADVHFVTGMIGHHAQALIMARLAPTHDASESIKILTGRIINAQQDEIALMQSWLRARGQPVPEVHSDGLTLMVHGAEHATHMPGMLTPEQLQQLDQARGPAFDRLFLELMIQHHRGAVTMVQELFATDGAAREEAVFKLASDVQVDQITEIARMERMLASLSSP